MQWQHDCQGKEDYDGGLIAASCRFYPGASSGHGSMTTYRDKRGTTIGTMPYGDKPRVLCSIILRLDPAGDDYRTWREAKFEADTDAEVKAKAEKWVEQQRATLRRLLGLLGEG